MKNEAFIGYFILIILSFCCFTGTAQTTEVKYTEKMNINNDVKNVDNPTIMAVIHERLRKEKEFLLQYDKNGQSVYRFIKEIEETDENKDISFNVTSSNKDYALYKDHNKHLIIINQNLFSKTYLIKDTLSAITWKKRRGRKKIENYSCKKATAVIDNKEVTAWYTEQLPVNEGPGKYWGLPGLILEVSDDAKTIRCTSVRSGKKAVELPEKGNTITRAEFNKVKEEELKKITGKKNTNVKVIKMGQ